MFGCNLFSHYKRMRIVIKYMGVHCTVYTHGCTLYSVHLNIIMMINQEKGKEEVRKYKGKGGYSNLY